MMFSTSFAALALSSLLANANLAPAWVTDYSKALKMAADTRKPIAVFISAGSSDRMFKDEGMGSDTAKMLRDSFVPVHVDTSTAAGAELAKQFEMKEGLVISDRTGNVQALRHGGEVSPSQLQGYLTKYAEGTKPASTEYQGAGAPAPATAPVSPASYYVPYSGMRSGCPNCR